MSRQGDLDMAVLRTKLITESDDYTDEQRIAALWAALLPVQQYFRVFTDTEGRQCVEILK